MGQQSNGSNFSTCLTVGQAASYLGVSSATLRNWDRSGKLKPRRHPQNGYRIYLHEDLEALLRSAELSSLKETGLAPRVDWSDMRDSDHFVQFYENDAYLVQSVSGFVAAALEGGHAALVIATLEHRVAIQRSLVASKVDVADAIEKGRYVVLDASDTLEKLMSDGQPEPQRCAQHIGTLIEKLCEGGKRVHAFGEMVALLWQTGNPHGAIRLEELWNELSRNHRFTLLCAYPMAAFDGGSDSRPFNGICACHSHVIPAESYCEIDSTEERLRAIAMLQQKAQSLDAEIKHRREVEKILAQRERELSDFLEYVAAGLHKINDEGNIIWANRADYELLGYTASEYVGHSIAKFHVDQNVVKELLSRVRSGEVLKDFPACLRSKDGTVKHVLISSNACFENGEFRYTRCYTRARNA